MTQVTGIDALPAGLPSEVLLRRPDVLAGRAPAARRQRQHRRRARGVLPVDQLDRQRRARASDELSGLFGGGTLGWSFMPQISLPIFQGGRLRGELGVATADRDIALAQYEQCDPGRLPRGRRRAGADRERWPTQREAQQALADAADARRRLSRARYEAGRDSYLVQLDAQRTLYGAQQGLIVNAPGRAGEPRDALQGAGRRLEGAAVT